MVIIVETVKMTIMMGMVIMMVMMVAVVVKLVAHKLVATVFVMLALKAISASVLGKRSE